MTTLHPHTSLTTVPSAFRAVVEQHADRPALEADGTSLTYSELDLLSNRVANGLLARGGEEPIAMVAPLEPAPIVVMLGALKAGRIFVPLDPRDPPERVALVREQLGAFLVSASLLEELSSSRDDDPGIPPDPAARTLVYFTSGSTGRPKGTVKSHEQLTSPSSSFALMPDDRFAVIVPLSFAASITPIFGTLLSGGTECLFDPITRGLPALAEWIDDAGITVLKTSPSALRMLATVLEEKGRRASSVRLAMIAGEPCYGEQLEVTRRVLAQAVIMNVYGSTEAGNIAATTIEPGEPLVPGPIPFRRVFAGQAVEIVDELGCPVPVGEPGEIVVRGSDVSVGYWEEPDEGEQRFLPAASGARAVRTGDRGRLLPDGTLEHLGRADLRVKVHGQMVDPQAVEHALGALPDVEEAVVSAVPSRDGDLRLVAHVLVERGAQPSTRDLRLALARSLPAFMIPSAFFGVDAMPRTERGKVDRSALRQAALGAAPVEAAYTPPRNQREQALADLVAEVLGLERVGVFDDVFELGADSFSAVELLAAIGERLDVELTPGDLLEAPTIEALARRLSDDRSSAGHTIFPLHSGGSGTPFFFVSSFNGSMLPLRRLARRLDRPSYSFVPHGVDRRGWPDRTVERVAGRYVSALRTIQPSGPYLIGGYSFGGLVAYEMGRELMSAGETVALVALLDPASTEPFDFDTIRELVEGRAATPGARRSARRRLLRRLALRLKNWGAAATAGIVRWLPRRQSYAFLCLSLRMQRRYRLGPYDGSVLLLFTPRWGERQLGAWDLVTGEKRSVEIPGNHRTLLREPQVATTATLLREALLAADSSANLSGARAGS